MKVFLIALIGLFMSSCAKKETKATLSEALGFEKDSSPATIVGQVRYHMPVKEYQSAYGSLKAVEIKNTGYKMQPMINADSTSVVGVELIGPTITSSQLDSYDIPELKDMIAMLNRYCGNPVYKNDGIGIFLFDPGKLVVARKWNQENKTIQLGMRQASEGDEYNIICQIAGKQTNSLRRL